MTPRLSQEEIAELPPTQLRDTIDYHNFSYRGSPIKHRSRLHIGDIYLNAATCLNCGYFIRSRNRHDFVTCRCGKVSVDGGSNYARRLGNPEDYINHIEYFEEVSNE